MPIFQCSKCGCVENTALCNYWWGVVHDKKPPLCSECDPEIGKWHGKFEKKSAKGMLLDNEGLLWSKQELISGQLDFRIKNQGLKIEKEIE